MEQKFLDRTADAAREIWLEAAYISLLDSGVDAVKILALAKRFNLSRTGFYWFFRDRDELLSALLARWKEKNTGSIVAQSEAYAETVSEALLNVFDCWIDDRLFDTKFEFAIRSWALQSADVQQAVHEADQTRLDALQRMFGRWGESEAKSDVRARTTYLAQIGYITMQSAETLDTRMVRIADYIEIHTGQAATHKEIERFFARNGFKKE